MYYNKVTKVSLRSQTVLKENNDQVIAPSLSHRAKQIAMLDKQYNANVLL